ncbi:hypothetical protein [Orenia marismortui]|uniref:Uncharacterized protein n=1 Tax=Orenia marismortui TaxID=46469 RepID=A0A4R8H8Y2_9FIRM|nr:hypothetical protein [Orenia marismortui]TDX51391.1 hypothetical protein C7959_11336 [Orenia marismortui]
MGNKRNFISSLEMLYNTEIIKEKDEDKIEIKSFYLEALKNVSSESYEIKDKVESLVDKGKISEIKESMDNNNLEDKIKSFPVIKFIVDFLEREPQN